MLAISKAWAEKGTEMFHSHVSHMALVVKNLPV